MRFFIFSSINWDSFWQQPHEVSLALSEKYNVVFCNPIETTGTSNIHLKKITENKTPNKISTLDCKLKLKKLDYFYVIAQEMWFSYIILVKTKRNDILVFYNPTGQFIGFIIGKILLRRKVAFMLVDEYQLLSGKKIISNLLNIFISIFIRKSDIVFCTAKLLLAKALKYNKLSVYLPNGVNFEKISKVIANSSDKINNKKIIGYVGTLGPWVNIEDLLLIAEYFKETIEVWVIGGGERYQELKKIKAGKKIINLKLFGPQKHQAAMEYMSSFDVAIYPFIKSSLTESVSPIKIFEYWAKKKCVLSILTNETMQYEKELIFYTSNEQLLEKIALLMTDETLTKEKGDLGFKRMLSNHNWSGSLKTSLLENVEKLITKGSLIDSIL